MSVFANNVTGSKARLKANIEALKARKAYLTTGVCTDEQRAQAQSFSGFGSLSAVFDESEESPELKVIQALTSEDELACLRASTQDGYYTPEILTAFVAKLVEKSGFEAGRIFDPAAGTGRLLAALKTEMLQHSDIVLNERDTVTADLSRIGLSAFPSVTVHNQPFESFQDYKRCFDLILENPPFGSKSVFDSAFKTKANIHNYFLYKSFHYLGNGGLMFAILPSSAMDTGFQDVFDYNNLISLEAAYRFPEGIFGASAGTDVGTDLVVFKRTPVCPDEDGNYPLRHSSCFSDKVEIEVDGELHLIPAYFALNPDHVFGEYRLKKDRFSGENKLYVASHGDLQAQLDKAVNGFKSIHDSEVDAGLLAAKVSVVPADAAGFKDLQIVADAAPLSFLVNDEGVVYQKMASHGGAVMAPEAIQLEPRPEITGKKFKRLMAIQELADALESLKDAEQYDIAASVIEARRTNMHNLYDAFVAKFGAVNSQPNRFAYDCIHCSAIQGLETNYKPAISVKQAANRNVKPQIESWGKADILSKRVIFPTAQARTMETAEQALALCLNRKGRVDIDFMVENSTLNASQLTKELSDKGFIFENPSFEGEYLFAEEYLSGNIVNKLEIAERLAEFNPAYVSHVAALKEARPDQLEAHQIEVPFAANWLKPEIIRDFVAHLLGWEPDSVPLPIHFAGNFLTDFSDMAICESTSDQWSIPGYSLGKMLDKVFAGESIKITMTNSEGRTVTDQGRTLAMITKIDRLKSEWSRWLSEQQQHIEWITSTYNRRINTFVARRYDGRVLLNEKGLLNGQTPDFTFNTHQLNAIWRGIAENRLLIDHVVGAGKTAVVCAIAYLSSRMGLAHNPIVAAPLNVVSQWQTEMLRIFPDARVLVVQDDDMSLANRRRFVARASCAKWDLIVMSHEAMGTLNVPIEYTTRMQSDFISSALDVQAAASKARFSKQTIRRIERKIDTVKTKLAKLLDRTPKDFGAQLSNIGSTQLFCDEVDLMKNLLFFTAAYSVKGLGSPEGSGRALDFYAKTQYMHDINTCRGRRGGGVFGATGTPLSNSVSEVYTLIRYFNPEVLLQPEFAHFDAFISVFSTAKTDYEINATGGLSLSTRYRDFHNNTELSAIYKAFTDTVLKSDLIQQMEHKGEVWKEPSMRGGAPINVLVEPGQAFSDYMDSLVKRADEISAGGVDPRDDNFLKLISDASKASLDVRLCCPEVVDDFAGEKLRAVTEKVVSEYHRFKEHKGTQLVFMDLGTPNKKEKKSLSDDELIAAAVEQQVQFIAYDQLKEYLINAGIPAAEIAYVHDAKTYAQRQALSDAINSGTIHVLLSSTTKGGAGNNWQRLITAVHLVTQDWRPRDAEQKIGRAVRRFNAIWDGYYDQLVSQRQSQGDHRPVTRADVDKLFTVAIYRYATIRSLDTMKIQAMETKAKMIQGFRAGRLESRRLSEDAEGDIGFGEFKALASGNPLLLKLVKVRKLKDRLEMLRSEYTRAQMGARATIQGTDGLKEKAQKRIAFLKREMEALIHFDMNTMLPEDAELLSSDLKEFKGWNKKSIGQRFSAALAHLAKTRKHDLYGSRSPLAVLQDQATGFSLNIELYGSLVAPEAEVTLTDNGTVVLSFVKDFQMLSASHITSFMNRANPAALAGLIASIEQDTGYRLKSREAALKAVETKFEYIDEIAQLSAMEHALNSLVDAVSFGEMSPDEQLTVKTMAEADIPSIDKAINRTSDEAVQVKILEPVALMPLADIEIADTQGEDNAPEKLKVPSNVVSIDTARNKRQRGRPSRHQIIEEAGQLSLFG